MNLATTSLSSVLAAPYLLVILLTYRREMDDFVRYHVDPAKHVVRMRLQKLLGWLTEPDDIALTDYEFVHAVIKRYEKFSDRPLIDPAE
jgi:hypothetical protein